jgi:hypothetical protein
VTVFEVLVAATLLSVVLGVLYAFLSSGRRSVESISAHAALRKPSRRAIARLLTELQEGKEVVTPPPGRTRAMAVIRDKESVARWFVQHPQRGGPEGVFELWRYSADRTELLLTGIRRMRFTCQSEGALSINLVLTEDGREASFVTTVRLRNIAAAESIW